MREAAKFAKTAKGEQSGEKPILLPEAVRRADWKSFLL